LDTRPQARERLWSLEPKHLKPRQPRLRGGRQLSYPRLTIPMILAWADAHHAATGAWPINNGIPVRDAPFAITWAAIHGALYGGWRGLPGGSSLSRLLAEERGVGSTPSALPPLAIEQILTWADAHFEATGTWPTTISGTVRDAPFAITWNTVNTALDRGW